MRVFFDASVIIAALLSPTGGSSALLQYVRLGKIAGITSQTAVAEILEEDKYSRIKKSKPEIEKFIGESGLVVRGAITSSEIEPYRDLIDIEDAHLVAGAKLTRCDYLVSLDKRDVLRSDIKEKFLPLRIVSPGELLKNIVK